MDEMEQRCINCKHYDNENYCYSHKEKVLDPNMDYCGKFTYRFETIAVKRLTLEELRDQFEIKFRSVYLFKDVDIKLKYFVDGSYLDNQTNSAWQFYYACAKANNLLREG